MPAAMLHQVNSHTIPIIVDLTGLMPATARALIKTLIIKEINVFNLPCVINDVAVRFASHVERHFVAGETCGIDLPESLVKVVRVRRVENLDYSPI